MRRSLLLMATAALLTPLLPSTVEAIPPFARKYGVSCGLCHSPVPRLNDFGETFAANGFEMVPREPARDTIDTGDPLLRLLRDIGFGVRMDLFGTLNLPMRSDYGDSDLQLPYNIKLLTGGVVAPGISYYMYFFLSERGEVAGLEDAYVQFTDIGGSGVSVIAGQFQVSDPLFKRELRLQYEDYQPYRVRVGAARPDLTYDRGLFVTWAPPWPGADLALMLVNGTGIDHAAANRHYDRDNMKNVAGRFSQELGPVRLGAFGYYGRERADGQTDRITIYGPDATVGAGPLEVNLQYLRREDTNPFLVATPAAGTVVNSFMAEALWGPFGPDSRWTVAGLYNLIDADEPVVSLRLDDDGPVSRYETVSAGLHYLMWRNVRLLGEVGYDLERSRTRLTIGTTLGF
jgi:hypothetical protein